jgi:hypothetical protein
MEVDRLNGFLDAAYSQRTQKVKHCVLNESIHTLWRCRGGNLNVSVALQNNKKPFSAINITYQTASVV